MTKPVKPREKNVQVRVTETEHRKLMLYVRDNETSAVKVIRLLLKKEGIL